MIIYISMIIKIIIKKKEVEISNIMVDGVKEVML